MGTDWATFLSDAFVRVTLLDAHAGGRRGAMVGDWAAVSFAPTMDDGDRDLNDARLILAGRTLAPGDTADVPVAYLTPAVDSPLPARCMGEAPVGKIIGSGVILDVRADDHAVQTAGEFRA
ncbi:hypothetical protein [Curtobacterium sp. MCBD17_040]|uniref:hypothetical protein n=1 Tax=Curtobacterium sp. MCBD17_040 TaxID=2175674 RepID=UPI000DA78367|nr:hypothetical protein [Curtobacterium sp. MCBD17_040]WIB65883.1 hypothetical protein DEI94_17360 [Curtobacterium sp. MCBD17_040]